MYLNDRLKQVLGLGFAASEQGLVEEVESQTMALKNIKKILGLPPEATPAKVRRSRQVTEGGRRTNIAP